MAKINPVKLKQDADRLEKSGKLEQAITLFQQIVEDNPRDWNTINKIGDLYAKLNRNRDAAEQFAKVADFYSKDGFHLKAIAVWKKIERLDSSSLDPKLALADLYAKQGLMVEAKNAYQGVVEEYVKRGKMRDAGEVLKKMAEIDPSDLKVRSKLADLYTRSGSSAKAVEEHVAIAEELTKKGHLNEAVQVLEKGLKIDPKSTRLRQELARIYLVQKNYEKAAHHLEDTVRGAPDDVPTLVRLGEAYLGAKKIEEAEAIFKRLLELDPSNQDHRIQMGRVFLLQGQSDRAHDELLPVVEKLVDRRDGDRAASLLQLIVQADPTHIRSLIKLAEIFRQLHNEAAAVQAYSQLTEAYIKAGQMGHAADVLDILVSLEPQNQQHKTKLQFVRSKTAGSAAATAAPSPAIEEIEEEEFDLQASSEAPEFLGYEEPASAVAPLSAPPTIELSGPLSEDDQEFIDEHLAEGRVFRKYGLVDKAADQFEAIIARYPDHIEARKEIKEVFKDRGQPDKAAEQCLALAEIHRLNGEEALAEACEAEAGQIAPGIAPPKPVVAKKPAAPPKPVAPPKPAAAPPKPAAAPPKPSPPPPPRPKAPPPPPLPEIEEEEVSLAETAAEDEISLEVEEESFDAAEAAGPEPDLGLDLGDEGGEELPQHFLEDEALPPVEDLTSEPFAESMAAPAEEEDLSLGDELGLEEPAAPPPPPPPPPAPRPVPLRSTPVKPAPPRAAAPIRPAAPPPPAIPFDLQKVLDEVDSYVSLGFVDDAREALREISGRFPGHPLLATKMAELGLDREIAEELLPPPPPPPPRLAPPRAAPARAQPAARVPPAPAPREEPSPLDEAFGDLSLPEPSFSESAFEEPPPSEPAFGETEAGEASLAESLLGEAPFPESPPMEDEAPDMAEMLPGVETAEEDISLPGLEQLPEPGGIDLGDELGELFGAQAAVEEPLAAEDGTPLGDTGLAEIFKEFKKGVDKQLGKEDYDTRYNLGIAYKEMGLVDEAIAEFQLAAKDQGRALECSSMLGICFLEKGMPKLAVKWFEKGLKAPGRTDEEYQGLRYDLAGAHEAAGETDRALALFSEIYGQDANFRDVAAKVQQLGAALR